MTETKMRASVALWIWRLDRLGELPARAEVVAAKFGSNGKIFEARQIVRSLADDGNLITWVSENSETVEAVGDENTVATRTKEEALAHGMTEAELPSKLRELADSEQSTPPLT